VRIVPGVHCSTKPDLNLLVRRGVAPLYVENRPPADLRGDSSPAVPTTATAEGAVGDR
jgi:hypothetical protein